MRKREQNKAFTVYRYMKNEKPLAEMVCFEGLNLLKLEI